MYHPITTIKPKQRSDGLIHAIHSLIARFNSAAAWMVLCFTLAACGGGGSSGESADTSQNTSTLNQEATNLSPTASFAQPTGAITLPVGSDLYVLVNADDSDGSVATVMLYLNNQAIREERLAPYAWADPGSTNDAALRNLPVGIHSLRAVVTDNEGGTTTINTSVRVATNDSLAIAGRLYEKNTGPEKNPHKGWNSGWSVNLAEASVGFQYLPWKLFEPVDGTFDYDAVEAILNRPGSRGRHFILRLYCDWYGDAFESAGCPEWIYQAPVGVERLRGANGRYQTDYNDENYLAQAVEAIIALDQRYDDDPRVHAFQIGVLGFWGEWHTGQTGYEISDEARQRILSAYTDNFTTAKIMGRYPWREPLRSTGGIGFHNDFFGPFNHSDEFNNAIAANGQWLDGPIGGEMPPQAADRINEAYSIPEGLARIETGRYSTMQPTDIPDGTGNPAAYEAYRVMHKRMGYNYQIDSAFFPERLSPADVFSVQLAGNNIGIAPMYYLWDIQFALIDPTNDPVTVFAVDYDLTGVLPAESFTLSISDSISNVPVGNYRLGIRILQPGADAAKIDAWKLDARNTYILFANQLPVIDGAWNADNALTGGWSILGQVAVE